VIQGEPPLTEHEQGVADRHTRKKADADILVAALAAKMGVDEAAIRAEAESKLVAKQRRRGY
jgi:hypothetical protein